MGTQEFFGGERFGLTMHRGRLLYGLGHGALLWAPWWLKDVICSAWNWLVCHAYGHDILGPWEEPPDEEGRTLHVPGYRAGYYPKICTSCGKRWPEVTP
jgi:hypothetical protein